MKKYLFLIILILLPCNAEALIRNSWTDWFADLQFYGDSVEGEIYIHTQFIRFTAFGTQFDCPSNCASTIPGNFSALSSGWTWDNENEAVQGVDGYFDSSGTYNLGQANGGSGGDGSGGDGSGGSGSIAGVTLSIDTIDVLTDVSTILLTVVLIGIALYSQKFLKKWFLKR